MRIIILGSGYVGLVTGICFAEFGHNVTAVDIDIDKITALQKGILPIYEPGLQELLQKNLEAKNINFTTDMLNAIIDADIIFIAIGTPSSTNGALDLSYITKALEQLACGLQKYTPIVIKSTVSPGTCKTLRQLILDVNPNAQFDIISNPEFLREGVAVRDFMQPDRIVIGLDNPENRELMAKLYRPLQLQNIPIIYTNLETAELIKYAANALLATKIAFINEMADLCEKVDGDVGVLAHGIGLDSRIGPHFLQTGPGFGGSCFPKDTLGLSAFAKNINSPSKIVDAVIAANSYRKHECIEKVLNAFNGSIAGREIAVLGVAFKANTDDIRESPALEIIAGLIEHGACIRLFDPKALQNAMNHFGEHPNLRYSASIKECLCNAHAALVLTEWAEFKNLQLHDVANLLCAYDANNPKLFIDLRNLYDPNNFAGLNMSYVSLGRKKYIANHQNLNVGIHEC